jgi:hypothetical protein
MNPTQLRHWLAAAGRLRQDCTAVAFVPGSGRAYRRPSSSGDRHRGQRRDRARISQWRQPRPSEPRPCRHTPPPDGKAEAATETGSQARAKAAMPVENRCHAAGARTRNPRGKRPSQTPVTTR